MTIGIKTQIENDEDFFLFFDSVQTYSKSRTGSVSKHPVAGKTITDHYTKDNPVFSLTGVVSFADLSDSSLIRDIDNGLPFNAKERPTATEVQQSTEGLRNFLPASISAFFSKQTPTITMDGEPENYKGFVDDVLTRLMSGEKYDQASGKTKAHIRTVSLYEYEGNILTKIHRDLVLTQFNTNEDPNTGDAIIVDLTFEQVSFVKLRTTAIPTDVVSALKGQLAAKSKKGNVNSAPKQVSAEGDEADQLENLNNTKERSATYKKGVQQ